MKYCRKCGAELRDDVTFCPKCGTEVANKVVSQEINNATTQAPENNQEIETDIKPKKESKKPGKGLIIGVIAGILIIAAAVLYFVLLRPYPSKLSGVYVNEGILTTVYSFSKDGTYAMSSTASRVEGTYMTKNRHIFLTSKDADGNPGATLEYEYKVADGGLYLTDQLFHLETFYKDDTNGEYGQKENQFKQAMSLYEAGNYDEAEEIFKTLDGYAASGPMLNTIGWEKSIAALNDASSEISQEYSIEAETQNQDTTVKHTQNEISTVNSSTENFEGEWVDYNSYSFITITKQGNHYNTYFEDNEWKYNESGSETMTCYEDGSGSLHYTDGEYTLNHRDDYGNSVDITSYRNEEGWFSIDHGMYPEGDCRVFARDWNADGTADEYLVWEVADHLHNATTDYVIWYSSDIYLSDIDVDWMDAATLRLARNEIYARHGRKFDSADLQNHFNGCSWYRGTIDGNSFNDNVLSQIEKDNIKLIEKYEKGSSYASYHPMWVVLCNEFITLRSQPDTKSADLDHIPLYAEVNCLGNAGNGFYMVEYNGKTGYALAQYLTDFRPW